MSGAHLIEVTGTGDDQTYRVVCPDGGKDCECWAECDEDHALECDEWVWRDGLLHGEFHRYIGSVLCIQELGCWMPSWDIEFAEVNP